MLKPGDFFAALGDHGESFCMLHVWGDRSHNLKIITRDVRSGEYKQAEFHSGQVKKLYKFLKEHFECRKFSSEEYLKYVADMKAENCPEEDIASEDEWRAELEAEFGKEDEDE